tara:strand:- start:331 stop:591 length:261 start_codon:yes stop_codon:yes gene_type:complete
MSVNQLNDFSQILAVERQIENFKCEDGNQGLQGERGDPSNGAPRNITSIPEQDYTTIVNPYHGQMVKDATHLYVFLVNQWYRKGLD